MINNLYSYIGSKIKFLAIWTFIIGAIASIVIGFGFIIDWGFEDAWWALFIIIFGPIVALVASWILYAFGQLVEDVHEISPQKSNPEKARTLPHKTKEEPQKFDPEKTRTLPHKTIYEFKVLIQGMRTDDLKMILQNEKKLYNSDEIQIIKAELDYRY